VFTAPPHKWLVIALAWEIALIAVLIWVPAVRESFGINIPSWSDLGLITALGVAVFAIIEATKAILRRRTLKA
jgi:Ca2+-transporting ATPase